MSSKKSKTEQKVETTSVRIELSVLKKIAVLRDALDASNYNDAINVIIERAFPNIDELVALSEQKEKERKSQLRGIIKQDEESQGE